MQATSITRFQQEVTKKIQQLVGLLSMVEVVTSESDKAMVSAAIREGKKLVKHVGHVRKAITSPMQEEIKRWIAKEKELLAPDEKAIRQADQLIQQFNEQVAQQQQASLDRIAQAEHVQLQEESGDPVQIRQQHDFERRVAIARHSTDGVRKVWTFAIDDLSEVPQEYLMLNEKKVREAIRSGERHIPGLARPGITIFQKQQIVYR
ncbi:MAG: hypothetical protein ACFB15_27220 [Cyclobacteriaceae bacterium]